MGFSTRCQYCGNLMFPAFNIKGVPLWHCKPGCRRIYRISDAASSLRTATETNYDNHVHHVLEEDT